LTLPGPSRTPAYTLLKVGEPLAEAKRGERPPKPLPGGRRLQRAAQGAAEEIRRMSAIGYRHNCGGALAHVPEKWMPVFRLRTCANVKM